MPRKKIILNDVTKNALGLEIGPSYNPVAPKKEGWNVQSIDHLDAVGLREKYSAWGVDVSNIEDVDYIAGEDGIFQAIGEADKFDYIIASHVIEHMPDIISFLLDCEKLLKLGGLLSLAIPDKRYCFDFLKPLSTTGQIIQANLEKRKRHSPGVIFDAHALHVSYKGEIVWGGEIEEGNLTFIHTPKEAIKIMEDYILSGNFMDVHAWQFTPKSLPSIFRDLINLGFIKMEIIAESESFGYEFFIALKKI